MSVQDISTFQSANFYFTVVSEPSHDIIARSIFILPTSQNRHSSHREVTLSAIIIESTQENVNQFLNNCVALLHRPWNTNTVKNRVRLTYPICGVSEPHTTAYLHKQCSSHIAKRLCIKPALINIVS